MSNVRNGSWHSQVNEVFSGAIRLVRTPSSSQGISAHGGDAKKEAASKYKRVRLTEGEKLTLDALPILKKDDVVEKLRSSPLKNKQVVDKRRTNKPPLAPRLRRRPKPASNMYVLAKKHAPIFCCKTHNLVQLNNFLFRDDYAKCEKRRPLSTWYLLTAKHFCSFYLQGKSLTFQMFTSILWY